MAPAFTKVSDYIFDPEAFAWNIPSGWTCPAAKQCLAKANRETGKIWNGPDQVFRCYSAVGERFPGVRDRLWANFEAVKGKSPDEVAQALQCLPVDAERCRIHAAGDFFSQAYFDGWLQFIFSRPQTHFWAFTKSIPFWLKRREVIPENLVMTASYGGRYDDLIAANRLKYAFVVYSETEAKTVGLEIDTDDFLAAYGDEPFALLENFNGSDTPFESAA